MFILYFYSSTYLSKKRLLLGAFTLTVAAREGVLEVKFFDR